MDPITLLVALLCGALIGAVGGWALARSRGRTPREAAALTQARPGSPAEVSDELRGLIAELPGIVLLATRESAVTYSSPDSERLRLVRRNRVAFEEISEVIRVAAIRDAPQQREISVRRPPLGKGRLDLRLRAIPVNRAEVLLLVDDLTEERRVEAVRRDFIANVSHELKTPVGAISLLAEALMSASDDPAAAQHFAARLHNEAERLSNLISDVIDLSRLQAGDPLAGAEPVELDSVVAEAVDFVRAAAESSQIEVVVGGDRGVRVIGMAGQLVTAMRNLLMNAITYSPSDTRVAVAVRQRGPIVEIAVKDQGIGIDEQEQSRIFERFYRIDSARSRVTGGTGLGLAIVRNVCRNHGGDVHVWSVPNEGSTFTIRLPAYLPGEAGDAEAPAAEHGASDQARQVDESGQADQSGGVRGAREPTGRVVPGGIHTAGGNHTGGPRRAAGGAATERRTAEGSTR